MSVLRPPFKAYDIRGRVPTELNENVAYAIGRAYAEVIGPKNTVVGRDIRHSSASLAGALARGLTDGGSNVHDIGLCGTEEVYFATAHFGMDGGIMVTASHNPQDYNGMKLVRGESKPISGDSGLRDIQDKALDGRFAHTATKGKVSALNARPDYVAHLLEYIDVGSLRPLKIVANPGNGCAGIVMAELARHLPFNFVMINDEPDGDFPNGIPNPLLPENRGATADAVIARKADFGLAWDGDFDRCFFFDERGQFIEGYYLVGLLAGMQLAQHPGSKIIHDPRLTWNTIDSAKAAGGTPIQCKTGHAFIKERMRVEDAIYGGEMSAHHYFRRFSYCDSGMIPWLLIAECLSTSGKPLSVLIDSYAARFPCSGEINFVVKDSNAAIASVLEAVSNDAPKIDRTDGISAEFPEWRFNLRASNTEPVLRLNVETRGSAQLLQQQTDWLSSLINGTAK